MLAYDLPLETYALDKQKNFSVKFLPIIFSIYFGCSKEPSHSDVSFDYPQHIFGCEIKYTLLTKLYFAFF